MANTTITQLPPAISLDGTESIEIVQNGTSKKATSLQLSSLNTSIQIPNNELFANISGGTASPTGVTLTDFLDSAVTNTQGAIIYRDGTGWTFLPPGSNGQVLTTSGAGANPTWQTNASGTVTSISAGTNISASPNPITTTGTISTVSNPVFSTSVTSPIIYGGTGTGSSLTLVSTSGGGVTDSINFAVGNAGATVAYTIDTTGDFVANLSNGQKFLADFTNATVANRFAFQTSTLNSATGIYALPSGTGVAASWQATNASDPTNASKVLIATNGSTDVQLVSGINGTGTYLPLAFYNNGLGRFVINTSGAWGIGPTATASYGNAGEFYVSGGSGAQPSWTASPTVAGTITANYFIANGTTTGSRNQGAFTYGTLGYSDQNLLASFQSSVNTYNQIIVQNTNAGTAASSAIIISNNVSTASTFYGEFGMNSSGFTGTGSLNAASAVYLTSTSSDLVLGTTTANAIRFVINSGTTDAMSISSASAVTITSANASALAIGLNGATNPAFLVDASTASSATGISVKSAAAAGGAALAVISSSANENLTINAKGTGTITLGSVSTGNIALSRNTGVTGTATVTSASANALAVGLAGATNPAFNVDASTATSVTGLNVKSAAAAGGLAVSVISSGANENLTIDAKGTGTITVGGTSTGNISLSRATTITTSATVPLVIGGTAVGSTLTLQSTSGAGTTDQVLVKVGNNGAVTAATFASASAYLALGAGTTAVAPLDFVSGTLTTSALAGSLEYDGSVFYQTGNTTLGRGISPVMQHFKLVANGAAIGPAIANYFATTSGITLNTSAYYELEAELFFTKTTAGTVTFTLTFSNAPISATAYYSGTAVGGIGTAAAGQTAAVTNSTAAATALPATGSLTTAVNHQYKIYAIFQANATTAGTLNIQITSSAGTVTPLALSNYKVRRIPTANTGTFA